MNGQGKKDEVLTAAECASRTGLTVRALRVYEDYGLIDPKRTASGWRCYGTAELVRLNTIGLLKTAGLTLSQIRNVTSMSEHGPSLQQVLEMQIGIWTQKKTTAERGEAVAEAALESLKVHDALSIDELCNLVRSLEMNEQIPDSAKPESKSHSVVVDPKILDRYVGHYKLNQYKTCEITRQEGHLFSQVAPWPPLEIIPDSETEFIGSVSHARYAFLADEQGAVISMTIHSEGSEVVAPRIDVATCEQIKSSLAARIQSNMPIPGSEAALRRLIDGLRNGAPNYEEMSPALARIFRAQLPRLQLMARYLGAIQSIEFTGVGNQGWDAYEVHRENGVAKWRIALTDGIITGAIASLADGP